MSMLSSFASHDTAVVFALAAPRRIVVALHRPEDALLGRDELQLPEQLRVLRVRHRRVGDVLGRGG